MKFELEKFTTMELYEKRDTFSYPEYQRDDNIWSDKNRKYLIDSILRGFDIPKIYFHGPDKYGNYDIIDGRQRLRAIFDFIKNEFTTDKKLISGSATTYEQLSDMYKRKFDCYEFHVTRITNMDDTELTLLFLRLQLGMPTNSGEKLNAIESKMRTFVQELTKTKFIKNVSIREKRFAREQVCAQICNNSLYIIDENGIRNSKFLNLQKLYYDYKKTDMPNKNNILNVFNRLYQIFGNDSNLFQTRATIISVYLLIEKYIYEERTFNDKDLKEFFILFMEHIKKEIKLGIKSKNNAILTYHRYVVQGADGASSIIERNKILNEFFIYYEQNKKILFDDT